MFAKFRRVENGPRYLIFNRFFFQEAPINTEDFLLWILSSSDENTYWNFGMGGMEGIETARSPNPKNVTEEFLLLTNFP